MPSSVDLDLMNRAIENAARVRFITSPNPWVGAVVAAADGSLYDGATRPPGGPHAERVALEAAGARAAGATLYVTLEPCDHLGRTGPCTDAIIEAGISRVVVGVPDPDPLVAGKGVQTLRSAGLAVEVGIRAERISEQLHAYLHHRRTGRPHVVLKLAVSLDGRIAAADGGSEWITGPAARREVHRIRAESDAIIVGAGTVRADDPALTVRDWAPAPEVEVAELDPRRIVLGTAPVGARLRPCDEMRGPADDVLAELARQGVLQVMVEGGADVASQFHREGLVDRYELFIAPALFGGDDARPMFSGRGAESMADVWRGRIVSVHQLDADLHVSLLPG